MSDLELWGGHECTLNRVGSRRADQTVLSGHQDRIEDLELFARLNIKALRYPVLWERTRTDAQWSWADERLSQMAKLDLRPVLGLVHHGAGPLGGGLLDEHFAVGLAEHAGAVARRYPHVRDWTPVNEPLTTARFSALYGLWHPHARDERQLWTALLNQIDAVRLSMKAIRQVRSDARLVQTEDLGFTQAVSSLRSQAAFENDRRWLTWDLLFGAVTPGHPMWERLARCGLGDRLARIADDPCPPDVIGVNYYVTSERFLDAELGGYPPHVLGGNEELRYADVEAVRVSKDGVLGLEPILRQALDRYGQTVAVTESHLGCDVEEQMAWVLEGWNACLTLRAQGAPVEAFTVWALLGSYDWNSLLTRQDGIYEAGVFDLRPGAPTWTKLATLVRSLGSPRQAPMAEAARPGWWRRPDRLEYRARSACNLTGAPRFPRLAT